MPPKIDAHSRRLNVIMPEALVKKIDDWRRHQPDLPNISEAIRQLLEEKLSSDPVRRPAAKTKAK